MTPSLVACCPHCGDTATLAVRDDPARLARMKATAERQKTVCGWRYVVVGLGESQSCNTTDRSDSVGGTTAYEPLETRRSPVGAGNASRGPDHRLNSISPTSGGSDG